MVIYIQACHFLNWHTIFHEVLSIDRSQSNFDHPRIKATSITKKILKTIKQLYMKTADVYKGYIMFQS